MRRNFLYNGFIREVDGIRRWQLRVWIITAAPTASYLYCGHNTAAMELIFDKTKPRIHILHSSKNNNKKSVDDSIPFIQS